MDYLIVEEFNRFWELFAVNERLYPHRRACTLNLWMKMPQEKRSAIIEESPDCTRLYIREADVYKRSTPLSSNELDARARFTAVAAAVKARKSDLNKITTDQQNFAAQKDQAGGKKTMKAYLWKICGEAYDAEHQG